MTIETDIYGVLSADSTVTNIVSTRIYPLRVPDEAASPFISYQITDGVAFNKLGDAPDKERKEIYFLCVSDSYTEARDTAEAVKRALENNYGFMQGEDHQYFSDTQEYGVGLLWSYIA